MAPQVQTAPRARVVGSNYTVFTYAGKTLAYLDRVTDGGVSAYGGDQNNGYEFVHPLGYEHPVEIVTGRILSGGVMTLQLRELWHQEVWQQFPGLAKSNNIVEVFRVLAQSTTPVTCTKVIRPPNGGKVRGSIYHKVTIVGIPTGETFDVAALTIPKTMTIAYTHTSPI